MELSSPRSVTYILHPRGLDPEELFIAETQAKRTKYLFCPKEQIGTQSTVVRYRTNLEITFLEALNIKSRFVESDEFDSLRINGSELAYRDTGDLFRKVQRRFDRRIDDVFHIKLLKEGKLVREFYLISNEKVAGLNQSKFGLFNEAVEKLSTEVQKLKAQGEDLSLHVNETGKEVKIIWTGEEDLLRARVHALGEFSHDGVELEFEDIEAGKVSATITTKFSL